MRSFGVWVVVVTFATLLAYLLQEFGSIKM